MKKRKGWFIAIIIFLVLVVAAVVSLVVSLIGVGSFDSTVIKLRSLEPTAEIVKDDQSPQLKITYDLKKLISLRDFDAGMLVFDSSAADLKTGKQKLKYDELIKNDKLIHSSKERFVDIKEGKVQYILTDLELIQEVDVYAFLIKNNTLYVSKKTTTSVDKVAAEKLETMKATDAGYAYYQNLTLYSLVRECPKVSLRYYDETQKYGLRFGFTLSKNLIDQCSEVGLLIWEGTETLVAPIANADSLDALIEGKTIQKQKHDPVRVNEKGEADPKGKFVQAASVINNADGDAADSKLTSCLYFITKDGKVFISHTSTSSLNDAKKAYGFIN